MCELYGITGDIPVRANDMLKEFYTHSHKHPHGWGMRYFNKDGAVSMCKEAVGAHDSLLLPDCSTMISEPLCSLPIFDMQPSGPLPKATVTLLPLGTAADGSGRWLTMAIFTLAWNCFLIWILRPVKPTVNACCST